jgi:hypothetical protein
MGKRHLDGATLLIVLLCECLLFVGDEQLLKNNLIFLKWKLTILIAGMMTVCLQMCGVYRQLTAHLLLARERPS